MTHQAPESHEPFAMKATISQLTEDRFQGREHGSLCLLCRTCHNSIDHLSHVDLYDPFVVIVFDHNGEFVKEPSLQGHPLSTFR